MTEGGRDKLEALRSRLPQFRVILSRPSKDSSSFPKVILPLLFPFEGAADLHHDLDEAFASAMPRGV